LKNNKPAKEVVNSFLNRDKKDNIAFMNTTAGKGKQNYVSNLDHNTVEVPMFKVGAGLM
jgi:selenocysteine lyase/cysteine desulfurase